MENIVRKGEIAYYKQFLLFSHYVFQSYISLVHQNAALCGNGLSTKQQQNQSKNAKRTTKFFNPFPFDKCWTLPN